MLTHQKPQVVRRAEIPAIHSVMEGGREQVLGILKEFRRHDTLSAFLPRDFRVAIAWVHLDPGQTLEEHVHPVDSMILICKGRVDAFGDCKAEMSEGDILLVPHGSRHGFTGRGEDGFWGLSIQFNSRGLYEDLADPWARFLEGEPGAGDPTGDPLRELIADNHRYRENFAKHRLFSLIDRGELREDKARARFFDCFQIWSDHFQRMVLSRAALAGQGRFAALARRHLNDEVGHDQLLAGDSTRRLWDPLLESLCAWFPWKMLTSDEREKLVLVHLVVEASATVFYQRAASLFDRPGAREHYAQHAQTVDNDHLQLGIEVLRQLPPEQLEGLRQVQQRGWESLQAMFGRIADLVQM
jgi:quercetin dioxygenase-like cupin family protein